MSKSKRDRNHRREEARYSDGNRKNVKENNQRVEKRVKNLFRSGNIEQLVEAEIYK